MKHWQTLTLEWPSETVALATLNRPEHANAVSSRLSTELAELVGEVRASDQTKVLVVTGSGEHFSAGADLKETGRPDNFLDLARAAIDGLADLEIPTIAAIDGTCLAGGFELALACDLRVAAPSVVFGLTEICIGALPAAGGHARMARLVGPGRAKRLVLTGERFDGQRALEWGVVDELADPALDRALALAEQMAVHAAYALRTAKRCVDDGLGLPIAEALEREYRAIDTMATRDEVNAEIARAMGRSATYSKIFRGRAA